MNRKSLHGLGMLAVLTGLWGCTTANVRDESSSRVNRPSETATFVCESVARSEKFVDAAVAMGVSRENAHKLYDLSGAEKRDVVTGFAPAPDRIPTVERAIKQVAADSAKRAFYVEVDIQNLGGLNQELGHSRADAVYHDMALLAEQGILALKADACSFRHGGDEFSFVIVGPGPTQEDVEAALTRADQAIRRYIADQGLAGIEHPKHPDDPSKSGAGIIFGVSPIRGQEPATEVFGVADRIVERKKQE